MAINLQWNTFVTNIINRLVALGSPFWGAVFLQKMTEDSTPAMSFRGVKQNIPTNSNL